MEASAVESVVATLRAEQDSVRRYQGFVRIRGRTSEGSFDARLVVIFERPEKLRVELLGAFGRTRWTAVTGAEDILVVFSRGDEFVRESDVRGVVGRLLGIPLEPREVMAILTGGGVDFGMEHNATGVVRGGLSELSFVSGAEVEVGAGGQVVRVQTRAYEVSYPTPWRRQRRQIPDRISIKGDRLIATLIAEEIDVNVELDPEAFLLAEPENGTRLRPAEIDGEAVFVLEREREPPGSSM
jgi:hypothetical protein